MKTAVKRVLLDESDNLALRDTLALRGCDGDNPPVNGRNDLLHAVIGHIHMARRP